MLLLVDKPTGMTSYDVIRHLKKIYPKQKIGHSGTLDPLATGLLLIGVGKGTKLLHILQGLDKTYIATIDFSQDSDTWDTDFWEYHKNIPLSDLIAPTQDQLETTLQSLIPYALLPLTPFSAKKINGKKLYEHARKGNLIQQEREMKVNSFRIIEYTFPILQLELDVGSGTYIRSIAHRVGKHFGLGGILTMLRRTSIGDYHLDVGTHDIRPNDMKKIENTDILYKEMMV